MTHTWIACNGVKPDLPDGTLVILKAAEPFICHDEPRQVEKVEPDYWKEWASHYALAATKGGANHG